MKKYFIIICFALFIIKSHSQVILTPVDSANISDAKSIAFSVLGAKIDTCSYLLLNIANKILLVHKDGLYYKSFTGTSIFNVKTQKYELTKLQIKAVKKNRILDKFFYKDLVNPPFFYVGSDSLLIRNAKFESTYMYFVLNKSGIKKIEFNLPIKYYNKFGVKKWINIDLKKFKYLVGLMNSS